MEPFLLRKKEAVQLSYDLPQRVNSTQIYPAVSPNGSTIILCGLETGLRVIWRGGRPFKAAAPPKVGKPTINGNANSEIMIIDSDDETQKSPSAPSQQRAEFEQTHDEVDPDEPYEKITRSFDIPLSAVRQLALPHVPPNISQTTPGAYPPILYENIVVAAICADFSVVLLKLPLTPPPLVINDMSQAGVQVIRILGPQSHQDLPTSVAVTYTCQDEAVARSRSQSRNRQEEGDNSDAKEWTFLVASTSPTNGGVLLLHEIASKNDTLENDSSAPIQRQFLQSGVGCEVKFNPSVCPSPRHSNLLVVFPTGLVRVYQCISERNTRDPRPRGGSSGTMDSLTSEASAQLPSGRFLLTLFTAFTYETTSRTPRRKRILDAAWVFGGAGILALLEDGSWGTWDIEGVAPQSSAESKLLKGQTTTAAVLNGRTLTQLSVKGKITITESTKAQEDNNTERPAKLAPMTPHTRKIRQQGLFQRDRNSHSSTTLRADSAAPTGGLSVSPLSSHSSHPDESVLLFYGRQNIYIGSLVSYLRSQSQDSGADDPLSLVRPNLISSLTLPADLSQTSIAQMPPSSFATQSIKPRTLAFVATPSIPDILVTTSHHLIFLCKPIEEPELDADDIDDDGEDDGPKSLDFPQHEDRILLQQGELDIDGMGRILDGMQNGAGTPTRSKLHGRSIGPGRKGKGVAR